jgi:hypothetical protein
MAIWNIFPRFGMFYQDKYGNPAGANPTTLKFTTTTPAL